MTNKSRIYNLACCALMTALMCIFGPISIPFGPIPISLTNFVIYFTIFLLGMKGATVSCCMYLLIGVTGLPVFSGYQGGLAKIAGPTGGYMAGFIFIALIGGYAMEKSGDKLSVTVIGMAVGTLIEYTLGTIWFVILMHATCSYALKVCVLPFILFDLAKIGMAAILGSTVRTALIRANLITSEAK